MVCNFSIGVTKRITTESCPNGWKTGYKAGTFELTTWYRITAWRKLAEIVSKYVVKGQQVLIRGEMGGEAVDGTQHVRVYETKGSGHQANYEVTASKVVMLGRSSGNQAAAVEADGPPPGFVEANEIPF